jgi:uncharacterized membrane protein
MFGALQQWAAVTFDCADFATLPGLVASTRRALTNSVAANYGNGLGWLDLATEGESC